jgi:transposase
MTKIQEETPEFAAFVGLDWADQTHVVSLQESASSKVERFSVEHQPEALTTWISSLRTRFGGHKVAVALEQRRGALIYALMSYDFLVLYPVNPDMVARYRKAFASSGAKSDPVDADLLLELVSLHRDRLRAWVPDDVDTRTLQFLVEARRKIVNERTRLTNRLTSLLKGYFPQALEWIGSVKSIQVCDFLMKWPTLAAVQRAQRSELKSFYQKHGCRRSALIEKRLEEVRQAEPLTQDRAVTDSSVTMVQATVGQLRAVIEAVKRFDQQIAEVFARHPDREVFASLPGAGEALAPRLLAAMGADRGRMEGAEQVQKFSGIAPVTERSGKSCWVHQRQACSKFLRQTFHEFAEASVRQSRWARAFYKRQRDQGKQHNAAVRALAYKWIRIIYRCWSERMPYSEEVYETALSKRQSPLASAMS